MSQKNIASTTRTSGQQGFTLIEIIAVLVILGILAAVATPRFMDLQEEAEKKAAAGAIAAAQSQISMAYAQALLQGNSTIPASVCSNVQLDGQLSLTCENNINLNSTGDIMNIYACYNKASCTSGSYDVNGSWTLP